MPDLDGWGRWGVAAVVTLLFRGMADGLLMAGAAR